MFLMTPGQASASTQICIFPIPLRAMPELPDAA
jgi:hypothetical protein